MSLQKRLDDKDEEIQNLNSMIVTLDEYENLPMVQEVHMLWTDLTTFGVVQTARQEPYKRNSMTTTT